MLCLVLTGKNKAVITVGGERIEILSEQRCRIGIKADKEKVDITREDIEYDSNNFRRILRKSEVGCKEREI